MNYDNWKLSSPPEGGGMVSSCCGGKYEEEVGTCAWCGSFDIGEVYDYIDICNDCDSPCSIIEASEYKQNQKDDYDEMRNED